jgi:hypothetical protein
MFEILGQHSTDHSTNAKHYNMASMRCVDDEGNPLSDKCGRPLYRPTNLQTSNILNRKVYIVDDGDTVRLISYRNLKSRFGFRQVKKAIRRWRIKDTLNTYGVRPEAS